MRHRRKRIHVEELPYFVTINTHRRRRIFTAELWLKTLLEIINKKRAQYRFKLYEFVIMPDHFHLIIVPPDGRTISDTIHHINGAFSMRYNKMLGRSGQVFQHNFHDHGIRDDNDYIIKARYIHLNPVRAGMVDDPEDYPWSSARNRYKDDNTLIEVDSIE